MAADFAISRSLVRPGRPRIRFLFIGSRLCSTLPSDPASRRRPCASLILRRHRLDRGLAPPSYRSCSAHANLSACAEDGATPLHAAALKDAAGVVSALLSHGADLNATDAEGHAPLHWAASGDAVAAVEVLLAHGASIHARADDGSKPLDAAAARHAWRAGALLLSSSASTGTTHDDGAASFLDTGSGTVH